MTVGVKVLHYYVAKIAITDIRHNKYINTCFFSNSGAIFRVFPVDKFLLVILLPFVGFPENLHVRY